MCNKRIETWKFSEKKVFLMFKTCQFQFKVGLFKAKTGLFLTKKSTFKDFQ